MASWFRICLVVGVFSSGVMAQKEDNRFVQTWSPEATALVRKMAKTVKSVETYQDQGEVTYVNPFREVFDNSETIQRKESMVFGKPVFFRIDTEQNVFICDGENVTASFADSRRYRTRPLGFGESIIDLWSRVSWNHSDGIVEIYLSDDPANAMSERFRNLRVLGRDALDGDDCIMLIGELYLECGVGEPVTLWMRKKDGLIRRVEIEHTQATMDMAEMADRMEEEYHPSGVNAPPEDEESAAALTEVRRDISRQLKAKLKSGEKVYTRFDTGQIFVNKTLGNDIKRYVPPKHYREVNWIYRNDSLFETTALPCELSGLNLPEFKALDLDGNPVDVDLFGKDVGLIVVVPMGSLYVSVEEVVNSFCISYEKVCRAINRVASQPGHDLTKIVIVSMGHEDGTPGLFGEEDVRKAIQVRKIPGTCILDWNSNLARKLKIDDTSVLIVSDGIVQGVYPAWGNQKFSSWLKNDIDLLRKGKSLRAARPMTRDDRRDQKSQSLLSRYHLAEDMKGETIHEDRLVEAWSFPISRVEPEWFSACPIDRFWVRLGDVYESVNAQGQVEEIVQLPDEVLAAKKGNNGFGSINLFVGEFGPGGKPATLRVSELITPMARCVKVSSSDWVQELDKPETRLELWNQKGELLWSLMLNDDSKSLVNVPVVFGNIDGKPGDEICVMLGSTLYIVNSSGELLCSRNVTKGGTGDVIILDRDLDGKGELYVKGYARLIRYDYVDDPSHDNPGVPSE